MKLNTRKQRLSHLHAILKKIPAKQLYMEAWARTRDCGTPRCAGGHAAVDPTFRELGLGHNIKGAPTFELHDGFYALRRFFNLSSVEANRLFNPMHYSGAKITKAEVLRRVRELRDER